jgi:hypothetical protein
MGFLFVDVVDGVGIFSQFHSTILEMETSSHWGLGT